MLERLREIPGEQLDHAAYHADFAREIKDLRGVVWKLERAQSFREPGDTSWEAFISGDWSRSLELLEADRAAVRAEAHANAKQGLQIRRVRVIEQPVGPYLQWELHALQMLAQEGFGIRTLNATRLGPLERAVQLPEVVIIGDRVLYQISYEPDGTPCGARRSHDPNAIRLASAEIAELYGIGEPLLDFFEREVAPLPEPAV